MANTPSTQSRSSSISSSRSSSPTYRLFPRTPKPSSIRLTSPQYQHRPHQYHHHHQQQQQPTHSSHLSERNNPTRRHNTTTSTPSIQPTGNTTHSQLTNSIERATLPMLAHLNQQLTVTQLEPERNRVRGQIQRQETVLTLSMLLKVWGDEEEERSRWSDDSDDQDDYNDPDDEIEDQG